jgi:hypothetical protein
MLTLRGLIYCEGWIYHFPLRKRTLIDRLISLHLQNESREHTFFESSWTKTGDDGILVPHKTS